MASGLGDRGHELLDAGPEIGPLLAEQRVDGRVPDVSILYVLMAPQNAFPYEPKPFEARL